MTKQKILKLTLPFVLMALLSLSFQTSMRLREIIVIPVAKILSIRNWFFKRENPLALEVKQLELENQLLYQEIDRLGERQEGVNILVGKVVYRPQSSFSSLLWINVGEKDNEKAQKKVIGKGSPVLSGKSVVGVVEYVGRTHSSVRLITDSSLSPSVRCVRGNLEIASLIDDVDRLLERLSHHPGMDLASNHLKQAKGYLLEERGETVFLVKGELLGAREGSFRRRGTHLFGSGFNYDFADSKGPARDLRTGEVNGKKGGISLLQKGDLLVTTGLDGVFPEGLSVATVKEIMPLKEGDYYFDLVAEATAGSFDRLSHLMVLPPSSYQ